jgi:opacity protein-like surface antigen
MIRSGLISLLVVVGLLLVVADARAQMSMGPFSGVLTGHLGSTTGADVSGGRFTLGASVSVVEPDGWGAEADFGYAQGDDPRLSDSDVQTFMMNLIGQWPSGKFRPFFVAGVGGMRAHGCNIGCTQTLSWTDWGLNAGAGVLYRVNAAVGLRGDARYFTSIQDHPDPARPDDFDFWRISVGVSFLWNIVP